MLDRWWKLCVGPEFDAMVELWVAARTDQELRARLLEAEHDNAHLGVRGTRLVFPELADHPGFAELMVDRSGDHARARDAQDHRRGRR